MKSLRLTFFPSLLALCSVSGCSSQGQESAPSDPHDPAGIPCDIHRLLNDSCQACHSNPPSSGAPMPLVGYGDLTAPSKSHPDKSVAQMAVTRLKDPNSPMPPGGHVDPALAASFENWVQGGLEKTTCSSTLDGGGDGGRVRVHPGASGLPCNVQSLLVNRCTGCHSRPPVGGAPMAMLTLADMKAPSKSDAAKSVAQSAVERMQNSTRPMPPKPVGPLASSEIAVLADWVNAGTLAGDCGGDGGFPFGDGGGNPYDTPVVCSSNRTFVGDRSDPPDPHPGMFPGEACISCHQSTTGEPKLVVGGTVYPTAHEPNDCISASIPSGAAVVISREDGTEWRSIPIGPNGNFLALDGQGTLPIPFTARVTANGRERAMATPQRSGDCNSCHTVKGTSGAPGRIMLP